MHDEVMRAADALVGGVRRRAASTTTSRRSRPTPRSSSTPPPNASASTADYRALWDRWVAEDEFRVLSCTSTDRLVQLLGDSAVFTHLVETTVSTTAGAETTHERETIVFRRQTHGHWLAVHEHLSAAPGTTTATAMPTTTATSTETER
ncbi:nuclear transport factor 2 family protein [Streptomyces iranensis]|uniref:nuclear transport factor 2 family protein n=1 Tax=Streptomyces iranensis TaxID=576784 RepID=UPI0039B7726B